MKKFSDLSPVDVRRLWQDEARDFTPWLASEDGLARLSDALEMELEIEGTEVSAGSYSADIVARDTASNEKVVIENQLGRTNHDHLGKLLTYAAELEATVLVWIARQFTDEHRSAVEFLSKAASPKLRIYGVEIKAWAIGGSAPAPQFVVVAQPAELAPPLPARGSTPTKILYREFWQSLRDFMDEAGTFLKLRKPRPQYWYSFAIGRSKFSMGVTMSATKKRMGCEIYMRGPYAEEAFMLLEADKEAIEKELGKLDWQQLPKKKDCRIVQYKSSVDINNKEEWPSFFKWLKERAESFHRVFSLRIRKLRLPETSQQNEQEEDET